MSRSTTPFSPQFGNVPAWRRSAAAQRVERAVIGTAGAATSYTTVAQAEELLEHLELRPGMRLLDLGAGRGWPGLFLAQRSGCDAVLTELPGDALADARARAPRMEIASRVDAVSATGAHPPFRPASFDAVVHSDVLC